MNRVLILLFLCTAAVAQVKGTYMIEKTRVSAHEPIILSFSVFNRGMEAVKVDLGLNRTQRLLLSVKSPDGRKTSTHPNSGTDLDFFGTMSIEAGKEFTERLVLNRWFDFSQLGSYEIRASLTNPTQGEDGQASVESDEFVERIEVGSSDPQELALVCEKLARNAEVTESYDSAIESATALAAINDPIAVPYLARLLNARAPIQAVVISALEKFDSFEATVALAEALKSKSEIAVSLAQVALQHIANTSVDPKLRAKAKELLYRK